MNYSVWILFGKGKHISDKSLILAAKIKNCYDKRRT